MARIMHFNFHRELDFVLHQRLSNFKNAMMLIMNFNIQGVPKTMSETFEFIIKEQ